jgi:uncharacterized protein YjbI with pentapeptide repeats
MAQSLEGTYLGRATFTDAFFEGANFAGETTFENALFTGNTWFADATFIDPQPDGAVRVFNNAQFRTIAACRGATVQLSHANMTDATWPLGWTCVKDAKPEEAERLRARFVPVPIIIPPDPPEVANPRT